MTVVALTVDTVSATIAENEIVLLDFWAPWCAPCRMFSPVYEQASERFPDIFFGSINAEEEKQLAQAAKIVSIPTLMAYRQSVLVFREAGLLQGAQLDELIGQIRRLDMDQVRAAQGGVV